jgi:protein-L-isoaspartate(D-aspartate) O-methyltransferase
LTVVERTTSDAIGKARLLLEIRKAGVTNLRILGVMEAVPRDLFVLENHVDHAHDDRALPIACGQTISQPSLVAAMTEALDVGDRGKVLEIGTGSGYQTAILAKLCRRVYTVERHRDLVVAAEARFAALRLHNITTRVGDGSLGWPAQAPFERIVVTAAAAVAPPALLDQLSVGGVMVIPIGPEGGDQMLCRIRRDKNGCHREDLLPVRFVPLIDGGMPADAG